MSTVYGGYEANSPSGKVNYGWIGEAFDLFKGGAGIWIVAVLVYGIVTNLVQGVLRGVFPNPAYVPPSNPFGLHGSSYSGYTGYGTNSPLTPLGQIISLLFTWLFGSFQSASLYRMAVKQVRGGLLSFADIMGGGPVYGAMLVFSLLFGLASVVGILALCVGLFVVVGLLLPAYAMVADGETASNALSRSMDAMKHDWLSASVFVLVFSLLVVVSILPCALGLFVTIPMAHIVSALAYRDMVGMPGLEAPPSGPDYGQPQEGVWPPPPTSPRADF